MDVLIAFVVGVVVGIIVYIIANMVPFLSDYSGLLGLLTFLLSAYVTYTKTGS